MQIQLVEDFEYQGSNPDGDPTEKQLGYLENLAAERGFVDMDELAVSAFGTDGIGGYGELNRGQVSHLIDSLMKMPRPNRRRAS